MLDTNIAAENLLLVKPHFLLSSEAWGATFEKRVP